MPGRRGGGIGRLVDLHKRERRTRYLFVGATTGADEGAHQRRLAGTEITPQGDDVAGADNRRQLRREDGSLRLVGQQAVRHQPIGA